MSSQHFSKILPEQRGAFFGRRKGHSLRPRQAALFETLLPKLAIGFAAPRSPALSDLFAPRPNDVHLEIGFGGGEHLIAQAQAHPELGFIGVEPFVNGMAKALAAIDERRLANIRLHFGDAIELLNWLPSGALARIDLLFPDPWPKKRHWKRRFVQDRTVADFARILRVGGQFRFATDIADYAAWTLERMLRCSQFRWTAEKADDWRLPWPEHVITRYQAKAQREGRVPAFFVFERVAA